MGSESRNGIARQTCVHVCACVRVFFGLGIALVRFYQVDTNQYNPKRGKLSGAVSQLMIGVRMPRSLWSVTPWAGRSRM